MELTIEEITWIVQNEFRIHPKFTFDELTEQLMKYLGSPDTDLRERSLDILDKWIWKGHYSAETLLTLANHLQTNLKHGLGEQNTDSVFLRAFSALIFGEIIELDGHYRLGAIEGKEPSDSFLTKQLLTEFLDGTLEYYQKEKDIRGYIPIKEWAHSIAHGADLLKIFARHPLSGASELEKILNIIQFKLTEPQVDVFKFREDLRITVAVYFVFLRNILSTDEIKVWFRSFQDIFGDKLWYVHKKDLPLIHANLNVRAFLNCIYFMVKNGLAKTKFHSSPMITEDLLPDREEISEEIEIVLLNMDKSNYHIPKDQKEE